MKSILTMARPFSKLPPRQTMQYDIAIVGAGPAGLATAIRLKQLSSNLSVCVFEKGQAVGNHILSGNCFQPKAFDELFPSWQKMQNRPPLNTLVKKERFEMLRNKESAISIPQYFLPYSNHGNYLISLGRLCGWMAQQAEELGTDIFPGTAIDQLLYDQQDRVVGVATKDMGINKTGQLKSNFERGIEIKTKQVILAEGCRGSLSEKVIAKYDLRKGKDMQTYGIGLKEVWQVPSSTYQDGLVTHTVGFPLSSSTYGGSFIYHMENNQVHIGLVVGLCYRDSQLNPYDQFQRLKTHPSVMRHLHGGRCIAYGARAINEGGFFAIPKLVFPGGLLVGCSAGFLNVMKIKGSHNAIRSGMIAAESIVEHLQGQKVGPIVEYQKRIDKSAIYKQLYSSRNFRMPFTSNLYLGLAHAAFISITKGGEGYNLKNGTKKDSEYEQTSKHTQNEAPSGTYVRKLLDNLALSGTNHNHDQPSHLVIKQGMEEAPKKSLEKYMGPEQRFCPAKVYQFIDGNLVINAQNCLHCKTCSIKMPEEYIEWKVPQSGGGPRYSGM